MKTLGMENVVEPSLSRPLWMFQEVLYILMCLVRVVTCTAKKETTPPEHTQTLTHSHSPLNANHSGLQCVCDAPLKPHETPSLLPMPRD